MQFKLLFLCFVSLMIFVSFENASAISEPILITISPSMEHVIFDGKWTHFSEWKQSSHNFYSYDNEKKIVHLRTAHFEDYIYVLVDPIDDYTLDEKIDESLLGGFVLKIGDKQIDDSLKSKLNNLRRELKSRP